MELQALRALVRQELAYPMCISKLAEILEKIIKAELIRCGWFLIKTHDLVKLHDELRERDADLAARVLPIAEALADKYFAGRYPGFDLEDEDWSSLRTQLEQVAALLAEVQQRVDSSPS